MMNITKKIIICFLSALLVCCLSLSFMGCGETGWDISASGDETVMAQVEKTDGGYNLVITGNGATKDFAVGNDKPWTKYSIKNVYIRGNLTSLGENLFIDLTNVKDITLPQSVVKVTSTTFAENVTVYAMASAVEGAGDYENMYLLSEEVPTALGNYWHYVDGVKTPWEKSNVMLIGDGFAQTDGIGNVLEGLAAAAGVYIDVDVIARENTTLSNYLNFNSGLGLEISTLLNEKKYSAAVIMTEGANAYADFGTFNSAVDQLVDKIAQREDGVDIYVCQSWGYDAAGASGNLSAGGMELLLRQAYGQAATASGAQAIYLGMAMAQYDAAAHEKLFGDKEIGAEGVYMTASVLVSAVCDADIAEVNYNGDLDADLASALRISAANAVSNSSSLSYPVHVCDNVCPNCHNCLDDTCTNVACYSKCQGHVPPHTCESVCPTCGGCLDETCTDSVCMFKCLCRENIQMARIDIDTPDGSNSWATAYSRGDKLAGNIDYVDSTVSVSNCDAAYVINNAVCEVKVRGNYTLEYSKKPIRLKFDKKQPMLGMDNGQKCKSWVLLAEWKDLAMQNNATTMFLADKILGPDGYYSTDYRFVSVYLNGQYWGVYLLVDQLQVNENRIDIAEPDDDYAGTDIGYLFEFDGYYTEEDVDKGGDYTFATNFGNQRGYTIKNDITNTAQVTFIKNYLNNLYQLITSAKRGTYYKFNDTFTALERTTEVSSVKEAVEKYIDLQSLVDMYILSEIACDPDIAWSSFYLDVDMSPDGDKILRFEAPWDFDSAYGIRSGYMNNATGLYAASSGNPWLSAFTGQTWFNDMVKAKWKALMDTNLLDLTLQNVDTITQNYSGYFVANYQRWIERLNYGNNELVSQLNNYKNPQTARQLATEYHKNWLTTRFNYLNSVWGTSSNVVEDDISDITGTSYYFEAEKAYFGYTIVAKTGYNSRSNGYLGNVADAEGNFITFTVNAASSGKCALYAGVSKRYGSLLMSSVYSLTVNGSGVAVMNTFVPGPEAGEEEWHSWAEVPVAAIDLKAGTNTITFTTTGAGGTNFDYIVIVSPVALS